MKLQNEFNNVVEKLKKVKDKIPPYAKALKENGEYKDFETRLANDCLKAVISTAEICDWYEKYNCNDKHIDTLAKKALKEVYTI